MSKYKKNRFGPEVRRVRFFQNTVGEKFTYTLTIFDCQKTTYLGKKIIAYRLYKTRRQGATTLLFECSDFACSPMVGIDTDDTVRSIMGFLTLRPGCVDPDYFKGYTPAQIAFANNEAESLAYEVSRRFEEGFTRGSHARKNR